MGFFNSSPGEQQPSRGQRVMSTVRTAWKLASLPGVKKNLQTNPKMRKIYGGTLSNEDKESYYFKNLGGLRNRSRLGRGRF